MTNVSGTFEKRATRKGLFAFGISTLEREGWGVARVPRGGKSSLRLITKGDESFKVSIRTSQDAWIAFPRKSTGDGWVTLDDVEYVVAVSVDDRHNPMRASVHMIPSSDARERYERAYAARKNANHTLPTGRGIWLALYEKDAKDPVSHVGAGMGLDYKALAVFDLTKASLPVNGDGADDEAEEVEAVGEHVSSTGGGPLTIADAKLRLAATLGVPISAIKIIIEH